MKGRFEAEMQVFVTFNLVSLAWVFFRAESSGEAFVLIRNMFIDVELPVRMLSSQFSTFLAFAAAGVFAGLEWLSYAGARKRVNLVQAIPPFLRYPGYALGLLAITLLGVSSRQFIYFQF